MTMPPYYPPQRPPKPSMSSGKTAAIIVLGVVGGLIVAFLGIRAVAIARQPGGTCMIASQPTIVLGSSPSLVTILNCAASASAASRPTYRWHCVNTGPISTPQVTITDIGSQPLSVNEITVAEFGPDGGQVASVNVFPSSMGTYIAPGASMTFTGDRGSATWVGYCRVESLS